MKLKRNTGAYRAEARLQSNAARPFDGDKSPAESGDKSPHSKARRERGSAVLVVLAVLAIITVYVVANSRVLFHLKAELKLIEQQQLRKFTPAKR